MKNILKKIGYSLIVVSLAFGYVTVADMVFAAQTQDCNISAAPPSGPTDDAGALNAIKPILHSGGGHQAQCGRMSLSQTIGATFEAINTSGKPSVFEKPVQTSASVKTLKTGVDVKTAQTSTLNSFFAVIGNSWIGEKMFINIPRSAFDFAAGNPFTLASSHSWMTEFGVFGNYITADLQKVNVDGNVLATNVVHPVTDSDNVCLDQFGSLVLCGTFSCIGAAPSNATMCSGDNANLSVDTANNLVASCGTPKCEFTCINGYHKDANSCVLNTYSCTGTTPTNATLCSGDDIALSVDTGKIAVDVCSTPADAVKCEYVCGSGYHENNGSCVVDVVDQGVLIQIASSSGNCSYSAGDNIERVIVKYDPAVFVIGPQGYLVFDNSIIGEPDLQLLPANYANMHPDSAVGNLSVSNYPNGNAWYGVTASGNNIASTEGNIKMLVRLGNSLFQGKQLCAPDPVYDGHWFVCGVGGNWNMGPSANSTVVASTSNYNSSNACSGATDPVNYDAGTGFTPSGDFNNPDMRCWNAVPNNCSCFTPGVSHGGNESC